MAGMRGLGRVSNVLVNSANTQGTIVASFKECSGIELIAYPDTVSAGGTVTVTAGTNNAVGTNYTTANGFGQPSVMYTQNVGTAVASRPGTVAWVKATPTWTSNALTVAGSGTVSVIDFLCSQMADTYDYIAFAPSAGLQLVAIQYDLTVQRTPPNLSNAGN